MATKTDPNKIDYVTLTDEQRAAVVREQLVQRENEHFRLYQAYAGVEDAPDSRLAAVTQEVKRLQAELKALGG